MGWGRPRLASLTISASMRTDVCLPIPVGSPWAASRPLAAEGVGRQEAFEALDELIALDDLLPLLFQV
jgi:hypothetical protein